MEIGLNLYMIFDESLGGLCHFESREVIRLTQEEFSQRFTFEAVTYIDCLLSACLLSRFRTD